MIDRRSGLEEDVIGLITVMIVDLVVDGHRELLGFRHPTFIDLWSPERPMVFQNQRTIEIPGVLYSL